MNRNLCTKALLPSCGVKNVLNRSFTTVNSLFARIFALPKNKIIFRAAAFIHWYKVI
jgi:hypothetical protein